MKTECFKKQTDPQKIAITYQQVTELWPLETLIQDIGEPFPVGDNVVVHHQTSQKFPINPVHQLQIKKAAIPSTKKNQTPTYSSTDL